MKKILLIILLSYVMNAYSQDTIHVREVDTFHMSTATYVDSAFGMLDTTRISTKFLLDRVPAHFRPNAFNGISSADTVKSSFAFYNTYASIYLSQVSGHPHFKSPLTFGRHVDS